MIAPALPYESQLQHLFLNAFNDDRYKFFNADNFHEKYEPLTTTWNAEEYVVLHPQSGDIIGYMKYRHDRQIRAVYSVQAISFSDQHSLLFVRELYKTMIRLLYKYNHSKIGFKVIVGNPAEKSYDRLVELLGGEVVGTMRDEVILRDHKLYDLKMYEVLNSDFQYALSSSPRLQRFVAKHFSN